MQRLKVSFVNQPWNPAVPPVQTGSIAIWSYEVARRLAQSCEVVAYAKRMRGCRIIEQHEGVTYRRVSIFPHPDNMLVRARRLLCKRADRCLPDFVQQSYYNGYFKRLAHDTHDRGCQVVHVHNLGQAVPTIRAVNPSAAIVLHMHCEWLTQLPRAWVWRWLKDVDEIVGCSQYITDKITAAWPEHAGRCRTIHNGVNTAVFRPDGPSRRLAGANEKVLLFVGRVTPEKGVHVLLDAFERVLKTIPNARLVIVGPNSVTPQEFLVELSDDPKVRDLEEFYRGEYESILKSRLSRTAMQRVDFVGPVPNHELAEYYRGAHVLVNPSLSESFGLTLCEAMACGLPVVVTKVGGMPEILAHDQYGRSVAAGDVDGLAKAIERLLTDESRRAELGRAGSHHVRKWFSWERTAQLTLQTFHEVTDGVRRADT